MGKIVSRCGYRCDLCAARSDDTALRQKMVDGWKKYFGYDFYTAENVRCDGCLEDGRLADRNCQARPCAIERNVENCAHCDDFICDKLKPLLCSRDDIRRRFGDIAEEDFNLCMRQFINMPELLEIRKKLGKS